MKRLDLKGQRFGKLIVLEYSDQIKNYHRCWKCLCDCGRVTYCTAGALHNGHNKSCGCLYKEYVYGNKRTHGMSKTRFYRIWKGIIYRCNNKNNISFKNYGKNGIKVCDRWLKFINFKDDMYKDYIKYAKKFGEKNTTIDRINNNDNYKLSNCRWANWKIQGNNRKNTQFLIYKNKKKPLAQWAREFNISRHVLRIRILKLKWPIKKALITN